MPTVQDEIIQLLKKLDDYEKDDTPFLSPKLNTLRQKVLLVHMSMENSLHIALSTYLVNCLPPQKYKYGDLLTFRTAVLSILPEVDYARLIKMLEKTVEMSPSVKKLFHEVNNYRVWFEHPFAYKKKLLELEQPTKYVRVLRCITKAYETFDSNRILREIHKEMDILSKTEKKD